MNSPDLAWSDHKPDSLSGALQEDNGFWVDDHWRMSACPLKPAQAAFRREVMFHFTCQSPTLNTEFKFAVMSRLKDGAWSISSDRALALTRSYLNVIFQFINTAAPHCQSLTQHSHEYWEATLRSYLKERGIYRTKIDSHLDHHNQSKQFVIEDRRILLLKYIYRLISDVYDTRDEWDKDIVDLCKLGYNKPELLTSHRLNFTHLSQPWLRKPVKEYFRQRLVNTTVTSLQGMLSDLNCFSAFLNQYPLLQPCEIDRRLIEDYLGYISEGDLSSQTKSHRLVILRGFLIWCHQRKIVEFPSELLIFDTDLPKRTRPLPRVIDPKVMDQFVQALPDLDLLWQRAIYILMYTGLRQHAQKKRREAIQRTDEAIRLLLQEQRPVNFKTVAEIAGVTTAWLYREESIKQRLFHLRQQPGSQKQTPQVKAPASEASKDQIIAALKTRVKELNEEVRDLKQRLEIVYGELVSSQQQLRARREGKSGSEVK